MNPQSALTTFYLPQLRPDEDIVGVFRTRKQGMRRERKTLLSSLFAKPLSGGQECLVAVTSLGLHLHTCSVLSPRGQHEFYPFEELIALEVRDQGRSKPRVRVGTERGQWFELVGYRPELSQATDGTLSYLASWTERVASSLLGRR